ncbi:MAG: 16S rRNA (cytosine(967)-C(5))-methyltransferase RsmB [Gammaproteobacteria bacterium]|nr:16S rRNA (cytosine(967)-C(5))-methyltransferase RsmB [Gammaproteobacteria bacterium]
MDNLPGGAESRAVAASAVDAVIRKGRSLDRVLAHAVMHELSPQDLALVRALVYGTLRGHYLHSKLIAALLTKPIKKKDAVLESLLSVGLFQLLESRQPDFAVVSATVDAAAALGRPHARGLINAVLRNFLRQREKLLAQAVKDQQVSYGLPVWLLEHLRNDWPAAWKSVAKASNEQAPMWLRVNQSRMKMNDYQQALKVDLGESAALSDFCSDAIRLEQAVGVDRLPGFFDGASSVQDVSAQLAAMVLKPQAEDRILDACAAPGGKTCHLAELTNNKATIVAIDNSADRMQRMSENLERLGVKATTIVADASVPDEWWDGEQFDRILLDAPCSATGVIRRHPDIRFLRRPSDIVDLTELQAHMLDSLWPMLKPGGFFLYATCSVLRAENHDVIAAFLQREPMAALSAIPDLASIAVKDSAPGYQLLPGNAAEGDGFYYALMQKASA